MCVDVNVCVVIWHRGNAYDRFSVSTLRDVRMYVFTESTYGHRKYSMCVYGTVNVCTRVISVTTFSAVFGKLALWLWFCDMRLLSHVQASAALTRLQSQDAERRWMSIHKFTGGFFGAPRPRFFAFFPSPLVHLCFICHRVSLFLPAFYSLDRYSGGLECMKDTMYCHIIGLWRFV